MKHFQNRMRKAQTLQKPQLLPLLVQLYRHTYSTKQTPRVMMNVSKQLIYPNQTLKAKLYLNRHRMVLHYPHIFKKFPPKKIRTMKMCMGHFHWVLPQGQAYQALEERALQIKLGQLESNEDNALVREEWMMELPDVHAKNLGIGPRHFRKNPRPDFSDRSLWTDNLEAKVKKFKGKPEPKVNLKKEAELREVQRRDDEQTRTAEKHKKKKKRDKSLVEMHQDKLKKKKKEDEAEGPARRPFSRDVDLQVNRFDEAQKKSIMKKAMHLDDRISRGQSEFL